MMPLIEKLARHYRTTDRDKIFKSYLADVKTQKEVIIDDQELPERAKNKLL